MTTETLNQILDSVDISEDAQFLINESQCDVLTQEFTFSNISIANIIRQFIGTNYIAKSESIWFYHDIISDQWHFDFSCVQFLKAVRSDVLKKLTKISNEIKRQWSFECRKRKRDFDENRRDFFMRLYFSIEIDLMKTLENTTSYLKECSDLMKNDSIVDELAFYADIKYWNMHEDKDLYNFIKTKVEALEFGEYFMTNNDIHVVATEIDKIHITFLCPFCYSKYKKDKVTPTKNAKRVYHLHGSNNDLIIRCDGERSPHCHKGHYQSSDQNYGFVLWITSKTKGSKPKIE